MNDSDILSDEAIERLNIEEVFGLTGGELEDEPLLDHAGELVSRFWYRGAPDYAESELNRAHDHADMITVVTNGWSVPDELRLADDIYRKVEEYRSSGETECPYRSLDMSDDDYPRNASGRCAYCDEDESEIRTNGHRYIYIGDGSEVVYVHRSFQ